MSGIIGSIHFDGSAVDLELVRRMSEAVRHRGPDDHGYYGWSRTQAGRLTRQCQDLAGASVVLGHRRLSIVDSSPAGWQPMQTADGRHVLTYNGEIYNYAELRGELESQGVTFRSKCDTEVLLEALRCWGTNFLPRLVGMFAFAWLDLERERLVLARDFFGIKPLYYARIGDALHFASEMKALLLLPQLRREADPEAVYRYLRHAVIDSSEQTLISGVKRVLPSHCIEVPLSAAASTTTRRYWTADITPVRELSFDAAAKRLRELFRESVSQHSRTDVPVGCALSGGIDSSAVVSTMRDLSGPGLQIHTFSYIAEQEALSEERWIDVVAWNTRAIVHKVRVTAHEFFDDLDRYLYINDEPTGAFHGYVQYRVFQSEKENGVKVSLDGQGADEQLCGYSLFQHARLLALLRAGRVGPAWRMFQGIFPAAGAQSYVRFGRQALKAFGAESCLQTLSRWHTDRSRAAPDLLNLDWFLEHNVDVKPPKENGRSDTVHELLARTFWENSLPRLLRCADRNSMAHSIECRVPFLTPDLVQFCFSLPDEYLVDADGVRKAVFRTAMSPTVPDCILRRSDKISFVTADWLSECPDRVASLLDRDELARVKAVFAPTVLGMAADPHRSSARHNGTWWRALCLIRWSRLFDVAY
jgi:asparagine synthase (glutamine-hydrolysing)